MNYIVLDMEWNQPWPGSPSSRKVLPVAIRGEIIQIGAVRVTEDQEVADEFQVLIKPKYYRHLNRRVSKLTGIKEARLKDEGISFPDAMHQFREWCGEDIPSRMSQFQNAPLSAVEAWMELFSQSEEHQTFHKEGQSSAMRSVRAATSSSSATCPRSRTPRACARARSTCSATTPSC